MITLGRDTFERVAQDPDNLADVDDLSGGCEGVGEFFGAAVSNIYFDRHGYEDDTFPILEPSAPPRGQKVTDHDAIRASCRVCQRAFRTTVWEKALAASTTRDKSACSRRPHAPTMRRRDQRRSEGQTLGRSHVRLDVREVPRAMSGHSGTSGGRLELERQGRWITRARRRLMPYARP